MNGRSASILVRHRAGAALALAALFAAACGAGGGFKPYRLMAKAAQSEESVPAQADDHRLKLQIRETLLAQGLTGVTPQVYMGHVYLIGFVDSEATRAAAIESVRRVSGVASVDYYLPVATAGSTDAISREASDRVLQGEIKAALAVGGGEVASRVDIAVLAGHAVLTGVVASQDAVQQATTSTEKVNGVQSVTNFLLLPEPGFERMRPGLR
jgi:osmotically-inducible protein OsmY